MTGVSRRRPTLIRASFFIWLVVPAMLVAAYQIYGLPHFIWSYDFYGTHADWSSRRYTRCTFVGPYGAITTWPTDGRCGWIAFFKKTEAGQ